MRSVLSEALCRKAVHAIGRHALQEGVRPVLDLLFRLRRLVLRLLRLRTRGVKVLLLNPAGEILLIRNSYGRTDLWVLPGGGVGRSEDPAAAARREIDEELGCGIAGLALISVHLNRSEGKRDTIHLFRGEIEGEPRPDGFEVEAAAFFAPDALPASLSPATRRRIEEHLGSRPADGSW
jgi:ADP-ribose pyrophosphatase YjhB (NUDIX family)